MATSRWQSHNNSYSQRARHRAASALPNPRTTWNRLRDIGSPSMNLNTNLVNKHKSGIKGFHPNPFSVPRPSKKIKRHHHNHLPNRKHPTPCAALLRFNQEISSAQNPLFEVLPATGASPRINSGSYKKQLVRPVRLKYSKTWFKVVVTKNQEPVKQAKLLGGRRKRVRQGRSSQLRNSKEKFSRRSVSTRAS